MSITKNSGRQWPIVAEVDFAFGDFGASGVIEAALDLPGNAVIIMGEIVIDTVFNSGTSDTLTVGDVGGTENRYASGVNGQAAALTALTRNGVRNTAPTAVGIKWTGVGAAPTQGAGRLLVAYSREGRALVVQPVT